MDPAPTATDAPASSRPIRLLIVDDDEGIRTLLEVSVSLDPRFELVGSAASGSDLLERVRACVPGSDTCPDIVLLDVTLPDSDGIDLLKVVRENECVERVALFTGWSDAATLQRAKENGADAVFPKDGDPRKLLDGLAQLMIR